MKASSNKTKTAAKKTCAAKKCCGAKKACTAKKDAPAKKVAAKAVLFTFRTDPGKQVYLAGCFNNWNPQGEKMVDKKKDGVYSVSVKLAPGRYQYKFVADGVWTADPECADWEPNDQGTINSVLTVA